MKLVVKDLVSVAKNSTFNEMDSQSTIDHVKLTESINII